VRNPPTGQGNALGRPTNKPPGFLPPPNRVNQGFDRASSLSPGSITGLVNLGKENPEQMRLIPRILTINEPEPNDVPQGIIGDGHLSEPPPKPPSGLEIEAFQQPGLVPEERVHGGGGGPSASSEPPKAESVNAPVEDEDGSTLKQPRPKSVVINLGPTHLDNPTVTVFRNSVTKGGQVQTYAMSDASRYIAGAVLLTIVGIEFGGWFMTQLVRGKVEMTQFQKTFARAGHAHAGVLVTLGLVTLVLADAAALTGPLGWLARLGTPTAAALISAGFFFSSMGRGEVVKPNRLIWLVWLGALSLAVGVVTLGLGLLTTS
jgi:hypothetical protein